MATKRRKKTDWKQFEEFVTDLERMLTNLKARVKTNDNVLDRFGEPRQVDATVRLHTGTTEILVIIECRNRLKVNDVTWVEQVYGKRHNLRAAKAILVSNAPLSRRAQKAAADLGVEIRTITEIDKSFLPYMFPDRFEHGRMPWHSEGFNVIPVPNANEEGWQNALQQALSEGTATAVEFSDGETVPLQEAVSALIDSLGHAHAPPGVERVTRQMDLLPTTVAAHLTFGPHRVAVAAIKVALAADYEPAETRTFFGEYRSDSTDIDHYVSRSEVVGSNVAFTVTARRGSEGFRINVPAAFFNQDVQAGIDPERGVTMEIVPGEDGLPIIRAVG